MEERLRFVARLLDGEGDERGVPGIRDFETRPPGMDILQQQARFDAFISEFNEERPHEALDMKTPAELYTPSSRTYEDLPEVEYPFHDKDILVTTRGRIRMHRKKINLSQVFAGQTVGVKQVDDRIWLTSLMTTT